MCVGNEEECGGHANSVTIRHTAAECAQHQPPTKQPGAKVRRKGGALLLNLAFASSHPNWLVNGHTDTDFLPESLCETVNIEFYLLLI